MSAKLPDNACIAAMTELDWMYVHGETVRLEKVRRAVDAALTAAGYRILAPGELDAETVERCAELIENGYDKPVGKPWRKDGKPSKNDECPHGKYMYEDCEPCAVIALRALEAQEEP